jgi:parvulin-like peptidyl-prolyl isomerase
MSMSGDEVRKTGTGKAESKIPAWLLFRGRLGMSAVGIVVVMTVVIVARQIPLGQAAAQVPIAPRTGTAPANPAVRSRTPNVAPQFPAASRQAAPAASKAPSTSGKASGTSPDFQEMKVMAVVNGEQITRTQLGQECVLRYGEEVLESMINRMLILDACQRANVAITEKDVDDEVERVAQKFGLSVENWTNLLREERGVSVEQYRREIIWPTLALRTLAAEQIQVSDEELKNAFETEYGPKVKVRIIGTSRETVAREAHAQAKAKPAAFAELAKKYCEDPNIASAGGAIPPIRKHLGDANLERIAFSLKEGQVSDVVKVQNQYFVLLCEGHEPERFVAPQYRKLEEQRLAERIRDQKLRNAAQELFAQLQKEAHVVNVLNDDKLSKQQPGVAATINNKPISMVQLTEESLVRHGRQVLEGEINRKLLTQELTKKNIVVNKKDLDEEVGRAAMLYGHITPDGKPDIEKWLAQVQQQDGATIDLYIRDAVWPSVALKMLVRNKVNVSDEDLQKGFEANYGPRVEALAIVMNSQREAQKVWEMARNNPTDHFFGQLAAQYSIEPVSKGNNGKVPPIRKFGGQPIVEDEAFKLKPGELSSILAVGDKFVILRCQGHTKPVVAKLGEVRGELEADILEKKLTAEMTKQFDDIHSSAQIDNFLAGTSQAGQRHSSAGAGGPNPAAKGPSARVGSLPSKLGK